MIAASNSGRRSCPLNWAVLGVLLWSARAAGEENAPEPAPAVPPTNPPAEPSVEVEVRGAPARAPRAVGDVRVQRELLRASPRQRTSELLSAAPGFFVDHEDGEGLGNDVTLRGFDLEHGSGIEMQLDAVPINAPIHVRGQGYADVDFIIPEVVESIGVLSGPYDPRQGDAAIVGSANFRLGVLERGAELKASYGSFNQLRLLGIVAPQRANPGTFAAVALRKTDGFGMRRSGRSGSINAQYVNGWGRSGEVRVFATGYASESALAGVVREDDVTAGRIGYTDSYPYFADNQGVVAQRVLLGAELSRETGAGRRQRFLPYVTWTNFRARQNYAGALETSQLNPALSGRGDLFETKNRELAAGLLASSSSEHRLSSAARLVIEPGLTLRAGSARLAKNLLEPDTLRSWDRRLDATVATLDLGAYFDAELTLWKHLRVAGGPRVDFLARTIDDHLRGGARRSAAGFVVGPRVSVNYALAAPLSITAAYGEGFRSLDPGSLREGNGRPFSRVRSVEGGVRAQDTKGQLRSSVALFQTWVGNEVSFVAEEGGLETQQASIRRGVVTSLFWRAHAALLFSSALSVTDAQFQTRVPGVSHNVPNVPPLLWRVDVAWEGRLGALAGRALRGRVSAGYTLAAPAHISDQLRGPTTHALAAGFELRSGPFELGVEAYNILGLRAADSADRYVSNWSLSPGQQPASAMVHTVAAPPRTLVASLSLHF